MYMVNCHLPSCEDGRAQMNGDPLKSAEIHKDEWYMQYECKNAKEISHLSRYYSARNAAWVARKEGMYVNVT